MFLLLLSREAIVLCLIMAAFIFLSTTRLTAVRIVVAVVAALLVMYAFGGLGNLRSPGLGFNDSSYIIQLSEVTDRYPSALPGQFLWSYMYVVVPLGNLNHVVGTLTPLYSYSDMLVNMLPDFLSKRLFPSFDATTPLIVSYFNVSTGHAAAWKFNGYLALSAMYVSVLAIAGIAPSVTRPAWRRASWAVSCGVVVFMFFTNALSYSAVSFALAFPVLGTLLGAARRWFSATKLGAKMSGHSITVAFPVLGALLSAARRGVPWTNLRAKISGTSRIKRQAGLEQPRPDGDLPD